MDRGDEGDRLRGPVDDLFADSLSTLREAAFLYAEARRAKLTDEFRDLSSLRPESVARAQSVLAAYIAHGTLPTAAAIAEAAEGALRGATPAEHVADRVEDEFIEATIRYALIREIMSVGDFERIDLVAAKKRVRDLVAGRKLSPIAIARLAGGAIEETHKRKEKT